MCGRATLTNADMDDMVRELGAEVSAAAGGDDGGHADGLAATLLRPRFNIAPSDVHWIVEAQGDRRVLVPATWGYLASGKPLINLRGERVGAGAGFRQAFHERRCVMVTDGFFEWDQQRRPFWYHRPDGGLVLLAGLFQPPSALPGSPPDGVPAGGEHVRARPRFAVLTTQPNRLVAAVHNRMPVVIPRDALQDWLTAPPAQAAALIAPASDDALVATPVSRRVNSVKNDDPTCVQPAPEHGPAAVPSPRQGSLF